MPAASVTILIKQLEAHLGVQLLLRTTRQVSLTLDGDDSQLRIVAARQPESPSGAHERLVRSVGRHGHARHGDDDRRTRHECHRRRESGTGSRRNEGEGCAPAHEQPRARARRP